MWIQWPVAALLVVGADPGRIAIDGEFLDAGDDLVEGVGEQMRGHSGTSIGS